MKILERHEPKGKATIINRITCENCRTIFEALDYEFHYETVGHGVGGKAIDCPVCGNHIQEMYGIGAENWEIIFA